MSRMSEDQIQNISKTIHRDILDFCHSNAESFEAFKRLNSTISSIKEDTENETKSTRT